MPDTVETAAEPIEPPRSGQADEALTTAALARTGEAPREGPEVRTFAADPASEHAEPLFAGDETTRLRADWDQVQASFVDEPRQAVEAADRLVAQAIKRMAEIFADEKARLEGQWDRDGEASTEDLRQALRRYRAFFGRVLSV
ncbi:MAG TPA: hypothetical protein VFE13_18580 [Caulobacteraceae bacterium]|jgi:hypothetical protein|nr:hypothetical protein [Caulobacteraceae bacterium]